LKRFHLLWIFFPAYIFFYFAFKWRVDKPGYDDFNAILGSLIDWKKMHGWDRVWLLFRQHNEHRLFPSRVLYLAYYYITGTVNFNVLAFIGDLQMFVIALCGMYFIKKALPKYWLATCFVWTLWIFSLGSYNMSDFAMEAVANFGVIAMALAAMVCFDKGWVWPGAVLQFLTIFSNGNGIPAAIIVTIFVINTPDWWKVKYAALPLLLAPLYYINFSPNDYHIDIGKSIVFFICSLGAPFSFDYALLFGLIVFGGMLWSFPYKTFWKDRAAFPIVCIWAFTLVSMGMAAFFRGASDDAQFQASRYLVYTYMNLGITFFMLIRKVKKPVVAISILIPIFLIAWQWNCEFGKAMFEVEANRLDNYKGYKYYYPPVRMQEADQIAHEACDSSIYCINDY
jgi:hypothetical protein